MELWSIDISQAYINGDLDVEIYMEQPEGFVRGNPSDVLRLLKHLYGLRQAGNLWSKKLCDTLVSIGFTRIKSDPSVYILIKDGVRVIIPVFIDDITLASNSKSKIQSVINDLAKHFKLRDLGPTKYLLGVEIIRDRANRCIQLSQRQYILNILERFGMATCDPVKTPMNTGVRLSSSMSPTTPEEQQTMFKIPYISAVGALMYLAVCTRPDIAYTVSNLARYNSNPGWEHWKAVKHLFRYLKGSMDLKLTYRPDPTASQPFVTYSDADHAGDPDKKRSTGGYLVKMGTGAVDWSSKLQSMVALSSTESEYVEAVEAGKEILWMRNLLGELGYSINSSSNLHLPDTMDSETSSILNMDCNSAIATAKNPEHFSRMKHLDLRYHWLREVVAAGLITPVHIPTEEMPADLLTKPLAAPKGAKFRSMMGLE